MLVADHVQLTSCVRSFGDRGGHVRASLLLYGQDLEATSQSEQTLKLTVTSLESKISSIENEREAILSRSMLNKRTYEEESLHKEREMTGMSTRVSSLQESLQVVRPRACCRVASAEQWGCPSRAGVVAVAVTRAPRCVVAACADSPRPRVAAREGASPRGTQDDAGGEGAAAGGAAAHHVHGGDDDAQGRRRRS